MKRGALLFLVVAGCSQGTAKGPSDPVAPPSEPEDEAPVSMAPVAAPAGLQPDQPEFWKAGIATCESAGGKFYQYEDAYGCQIDGDPTLSIRFDGRGQIVGIERFGKKQGDGDSKLEGVSIDTYPGGGRMIEQLYRGGVADGPTVHYHPNGAKALEGRFVNDKPEGRFVGWDGNGKELGSFEMKNGSGEWIEWYPDGKPKLKKVLLDGKENGEHREWFEDGSAKRQVRFEKGEPIGMEKRWRSPNVMSSEGAWAAGGNKVGEWRVYDRKGELAEVETYVGGLRRWVSPYQDGKPVGALGKPGKCATDLEGEVKRQQKRELRHVCVREPQLFPGVVVISDMVNDLGCEKPVAYADCDLRKPLSGEALLKRVGWSKASKGLRSELARVYVLEVALQGRGVKDPEVTDDAGGGVTVTASVQPRIGMSGPIGDAESVTFVISPTGKITRK